VRTGRPTRKPRGGRGISSSESSRHEQNRYQRQVGTRTELTDNLGSGDYTTGDYGQTEPAAPPAAAPAPPPIPVAGAATAHSISMLASLAPDPNSQPGNHQSHMLASNAQSGTTGTAPTTGGGYAYAGTAAGGYGLMGGDFTGGPKGGADDDADNGGGVGGGMGGPGGAGGGFGSPAGGASGGGGGGPTM